MDFKKDNKKVSFTEINGSNRKKISTGMRASSIFGKFLKLILGMILVFFSLLFVVLAISLEPILSTYSSVKTIQDEFNSLVTVDLPAKDLSKLDERFNKIESSLSVAESQFSSFDFLNSFALTRGYYNNLSYVRDLVKQSRAIFIKVRPQLKDILITAGYQVDKNAPTTVTDTTSTTTKNSTQNLSGLMKTLPELANLYGEIEPDIQQVIKTVNKIDPAYLPSSIRGKIITIQDQTKPLETNFPEFSKQILGTLQVLPDLLGTEKPTNYLIIFQNEKEMRASGGLLTAYGNMTIQNGEVVGDITSTDMWDLEIYVSSTLGKAPNYQNIYGQKVLMERGCGDLHLRAQDAGIYPDGQLSINMFKDYYNIASKYNPKKYPAYDHVIMLDTLFASDLIKLIEPISLPDGRVITSDNLAKVIFAQTNNSRAPGRKSIIGDIADVVKVKYQAMPTSELPKVLSAFIKTLEAKNLILSSKDASMLDFMDSMGLTGRISKDFQGDYFSLSEAQVCGLKANFYIRDSVEQNINIDKNGKVSNNVNITWSNSKVFDPKERDILSDSNNYLYRAWIRVMTPSGTEYTASNGKETSRGIYDPVQYYESKMDKQVADSIIWFDHRRMSSNDPIRTLKLNVAYNEPSSVKYTDTDGYKMLIQKHPGKADEKYVINLTFLGKKYTEEFALDRDKVIIFKDGVLQVENYDHPLDKILSIVDNL
ncbi:MAG: DUF4012 domain-containing protein [bacterium]